MEVSWLYEDLLALWRLLYSYMNAISFTKIIEKSVFFFLEYKCINIALYIFFLEFGK